jgi:hypothetical protein
MCSATRSRYDGRCTSGPSWAMNSRSPATGCSSRWRGSRCRSRGTSRPAASWPCSKGRSRGRPCCCAATWTPCPCPRTPDWTSHRTSTGACMPAGTTRTPRCCPAPRTCSASGATTSPGGCCSCSSPERRATTVHGSCSTRASSTCRSAPTGPSHRSIPPSRCTSPRHCRAAGSAVGGGRSWRRPTR